MDNIKVLSESVLNKSNIMDKSNYDKIYLISIDDEIALWKKELNNNKKYFYTNLEGNILFDRSFQYATPIYNSKCLIMLNNKYYLLDLSNNELVSIPSNINNISNFRNNHLLLFNKDKWKWGSISYDDNNKTLKEYIPYIWDTLDISKENGYVYIGNHYITRRCNDYYKMNHSYLYIIPVIKMSLLDACNLEHYNHILEVYKYGYNVINYVEKNIKDNISDEERNKIIKEYIQTYLNISDNMDNENLVNTHNSNKLIYQSNIDSYKLVKGIYLNK